jgi:hypothetical protein
MYENLNLKFFNTILTLTNKYQEETKITVIKSKLLENIPKSKQQGLINMLR